MAEPWTTMRDAIQAAIVRASGIPTGHVIWKFQNTDAPSLRYVAMTVGAASNPGQDGLVAITDPLLGQPGARPAGQEVELQVRGFREFILGLEIFTDATVDSAESNGDDALAVAERIRSSLILPSVRDPLGEAGVVPFDPGGSQYLPDIVAIGFRGRALLDIRCFGPAAAVSDFVGYIARVGGSLTTSGGGVAGADVQPFVAP